VERAFEEATMLVCAAAVADYAPATVAPEKLSKSDGELTSVPIVKTRDILADMSSKKDDRIVIGFAAETNDLSRRAVDKLARKGCDAIVANDVSRSESTFGSDTDAVLWVTGEGAEEIPCMDKQDLAYELLKRAKELKS
ncbi:MAG: phosphopantothenoylcysteine decarboxylase, partial [Collinsella intestinalis]|nr:phosphopantothenoylcysteine decarboxylase [Collinsella intestinalis]